MLRKPGHEKRFFTKLFGIILFFVISLLRFPLPLIPYPSGVDPLRIAEILAFDGNYLTIDKGVVHGVQKGMKGMLRFTEKDIDGKNNFISKGLFEVIKVEEETSIILVKTLPKEINIKDAANVFFEEKLIPISSPPSFPKPTINSTQIKPQNPQMPDVEKKKSEVKAIEKTTPIIPKETVEPMENISNPVQDYNRWADEAYDENKYEEAIRLYKKALEIQPGNMYAKEGLAKCMSRLENKPPKVEPVGIPTPPGKVGGGPKIDPGKKTGISNSTTGSILSNVILVAAGAASVGGAYAATVKTSSDANTIESGIEINAENKSSYIFNIKIKTTGNWVEHTLEPGKTANFRVPKSADCTPISYTWESAGRSYTGTVNIKSNCFFSVSDDPVQSGCTLVAASVPDC